MGHVPEAVVRDTLGNVIKRVLVDHSFHHFGSGCHACDVIILQIRLQWFLSLLVLSAPSLGTLLLLCFVLSDQVLNVSIKYLHLAKRRGGIEVVWLWYVPTWLAVAAKLARGGGSVTVALSCKATRNHSLLGESLLAVCTYPVWIIQCL